MGVGASCVRRDRDRNEADVGRAAHECERLLLTDATRTEPLPVGRPVRVCSILFLASLAVRLAILIGPLNGGPELLYDERGYFEAARGFREIYLSWSRGEEPPPDTYRLAYRRGIWPPLHPAILGLSLWLFGVSSTVARCAVAVLSALTTVVVYGLTRRLFDSRAALAAALLHLFYPSFLAFSHYLWSESTYVLALLLAIWLFAATRDATTTRGLLLRATACGVCLGLATLTRAPGVLYLLAGPVCGAWAWRRQPRRWLAVAGFVLGMVATVLPWQWTLLRREGTFLLLSTATGYNMLQGTTSDEGSIVSSRIREEAARTQTHPDLAARRLARIAIARHPGEFARHMWDRFRLLWRPDDFIIRHLLHARYPPVSPAAAWGCILFLTGAYLGLVGLIVWGFLARNPPRAQRWLAVAAAIGLASPLLTVSNTRMAYPILAVLLPVAGRGLTELRRVPRWRRRAAIAAAVVTLNLWSVCASPAEWTSHWAPSSHYREVVARVDRLLGGRTPVTDCVALHRTDSTRSAPTYRLTLRGGFEFKSSRKVELVWTPRPGRRRVAFLATGYPSFEPLEMEIRTVAGPAYAVLVKPIAKEYWHQPHESGIPGLLVSWCGGAPSRAPPPAGLHNGSSWPGQ